MAKKIAVDIDGTATVLDPKELLAVSIKNGQPIPLTPSFVNYCITNAPLMPGVEEVLKELDERPNTQIEFVSNRPEFFSEPTGKWVRDLDLPVTEYQCMGNGLKGEERPDIDVIIDNAVHNVRSVVDNGGVGIIFDPTERYNRGSFERQQDMYIARDWSEVLEVFLSEVQGQELAGPMSALA